METELPELFIKPQRDLPEEWKKKTIGSVAKVTSGGTPNRNKKEYWNGNIPWVTTTLIDFNLIKEAYEYITQLGLKNSATKLFPVGTIIMAMYGQGKTRGKVAMLGIEATTNQACAAIIVDETLGDAQFVFQNLSGRYEEIRKLSNIGNQENLNGEIIKQIPLELPPLAEQQRIAAILTKWDEGIEKLQAIIARTKQRKEGLMQQLLIGIKRFAEFDGQPWEMVRFGDVFSYVRNESHSRDCLTYEETENQVYYVHYGDIHATFDTSILDFSKETRIPQLKDEVVLSKQSAFLQDGDLLIADASEDYEGIGECVEVKNLGDKVAVGGLHTIIARDSHNLTVPGFRNYLLMHPEVAIAIRKVANGISVYGLSKTALSNIILYLPPLAEQRRIAAVLSAADLEIEGLTRELNLMQNQKRGLMQGLMTGNISVKTMKTKSA